MRGFEVVNPQKRCWQRIRALEMRLKWSCVQSYFVFWWQQFILQPWALYMWARSPVCATVYPWPSGTFSKPALQLRDVCCWKLGLKWSFVPLSLGLEAITIRKDVIISQRITWFIIINGRCNVVFCSLLNAWIIYWVIRVIDIMAILRITDWPSKISHNTNNKISGRNFAKRLCNMIRRSRSEIIVIHDLFKSRIYFVLIRTWTGF